MVSARRERAWLLPPSLVEAANCDLRLSSWRFGPGPCILFRCSSSATCGRLPERPKGADCKSAGIAFEGSNPSSATQREAVSRLVETQDAGPFSISPPTRERPPALGTEVVAHCRRCAENRSQTDISAEKYPIVTQVRSPLFSSCRVPTLANLLPRRLPCEDTWPGCRVEASRGVQPTASGAGSHGTVDRGEARP